MTTELRRLITPLEEKLPDLEKQRNVSAYGNDLYEAVDDWLRLARHAISNDTRVDFPERVRGEMELLQRLETVQPADTEALTLLQGGKRLLAAIGRINPPAEGHLGVLTTIKTRFSFVQENFGFSTKNVHPLGLTFTSNRVHLNLAYARRPYLSCSFGPEVVPASDFWVDDLLFMNGDERYKSLPENLDLSTTKDVDAWFSFLAEIFRRYGEPVFLDEPGVFAKLAHAQRERDTKLIRKAQQESNR